MIQVGRGGEPTIGGMGGAVYGYDTQFYFTNVALTSNQVCGISRFASVFLTVDYTTGSKWNWWSYLPSTSRSANVQNISQR